MRRPPDGRVRRAAQDRRRRCGVGVAALTTVALTTVALAACATPAPPADVVVAGAPDAQSQVLAAVYAAAIRTSGSPARVDVVDDPIAALDAGAATVTPGLTGRLLGRFDPANTVTGGERVYRALLAALPEGLAAGDYTTAAQDAPALAVTEATSRRWDSSEVSAVVTRCGDVRFGAVAGSPVPARIGRCVPSAPAVLADAAALWTAVGTGAVDAAWTSTAAPDVPGALVVLADRRPARFRAENVVPLYRRNALTEAQTTAMNQVAGELDTAGLAAMVARVDAGDDANAVADAWLAEHPLGV